MSATPTEMDTEGAIATTPASRRVVTGPVRVNLIPAEIGEAKALRATIVAAAGAAVVAGIVVGVLYHAQSSKVADAKAQLASAQATGAKLKATEATLGSVDGLYAKVNAAEAMINSAEAPQVLFSRYLEDLRVQLPDHDWLTALAATETTPTGTPAASAQTTSVAPTAGSIGTLTFGGSAYTHEDVASLLDKLASLRGISNPTLGSSTQTLLGTGPNALPTVTWSITAALNSSALKSSYDGTVTP